MKTLYPWREASAWSLPFWKLRFRFNFLAALSTSSASSPLPNTSSLRPFSSFWCFDHRSISSRYPFAHTILPKKYAPLEKVCLPEALSEANFSPISKNLGLTP
uniref:Uncharacterized protein n=1 Tax=Opuntia streptacantha TaxID=393608 RepID=A0A7C9DFL7_OPUST